MFFVIMFWVFLSIIGLALFAIGAFGLYKMAINAQMENPWLAWIPVGNFYLLGKMIGNVKIAEWVVPYLELIFPVGLVLSISLLGIPVIGQIVGLAYMVVFLFALNKLYKGYRPESAALFTVLSAIGLFPVIFYLIKDDGGSSYYG